jgi:apolipoprotein N-acyltransferase
MVIEPHGQILYETKPFEEVITVEEIRMGSVETIYRRGGWIFPWLWTFIWAGFGIKAFRERKNTKDAETTAPTELTLDKDS